MFEGSEIILDFVEDNALYQKLDVQAAITGFASNFHKDESCVKLAPHLLGVNIA